MAVAALAAPVGGVPLASFSHIVSLVLIIYGTSLPQIAFNRDLQISVAMLPI